MVAQAAERGRLSALCRQAIAQFLLTAWEKSEYLFPDLPSLHADLDKTVGEAALIQQSIL